MRSLVISLFMLLLSVPLAQASNDNLSNPIAKRILQLVEGGKCAWLYPNIPTYKHTPRVKISTERIKHINDSYVIVYRAGDNEAVLPIDMISMMMPCSKGEQGAFYLRKKLLKIREGKWLYLQKNSKKH